MSFTPDISSRRVRARSYLLQLERAFEAEFPAGFPIHLGEQNTPLIDAPPRVVWYPVIGEIREPTNTSYTERFTQDGTVLGPDDADQADQETVTREIVAERHLNLAFEVWGADTIEADLLVNAVYARIKRVIPRVIRAQETWLRDEQQTTLGRVVTLLISVPVPVSDDDDESSELLASVVARVNSYLPVGPVNDQLETPPILLNP